MIPKPECLICCQRLALDAAKQVTDDESAHNRVVLKTIEVVKEFPQDLDSFLLGLKAMEIVEEVTGNTDPYRDFKKRSNEQAEGLASIIEERIGTTPDPLVAASRAAVMGNVMDAIHGHSLGLDNSIESLLEKQFTNISFTRSVHQLCKKEIPSIRTNRRTESKKRRS